jgi:hypothetical protein
MRLCKKNRVRRGLEELERRDVPSAALGAIPGLATAAVNSDGSAHGVGALGQAIQRQMPPAGSYAAMGNAVDHVVTISYASTSALQEPGYDMIMGNHNETFVRDGRRRVKSK